MGGSNSKTEKPGRLASEEQLVVPGPDWSWWSYADIGPGNVGRVIDVGWCTDVIVKWDSGVSETYPPFSKGPSGLRLYDSRQTGVQHRVGKCGECKGPLIGTRWKCKSCSEEYNLCHMCYMGDKHSLDHVFYRFDIPGTKGVEVPPRGESTKTEVIGIFPGAKVVPGRRMFHSEEDVGGVGTVLTVGKSDNDFERKEVCVQWTSGGTTSHEISELKCLEAASGGYFYADHMPLLVEPFKRLFDPYDHNFKLGDQVAIMLDVDTLRRVLEERGLWDAHFEKYIYRVGTVQNAPRESNLISVAFGTDLIHSVYPPVLTKVPVLYPGDRTIIIDDFDVLRKFQIDHGGCIEDMRNCTGKTGVVLKVFSTQDVRVMVSGSAWTFSRASLRTVAPSADRDNSFRLGDVARQNGLCSAVTRILPSVLEGHLEEQLGPQSTEVRSEHPTSEEEATSSQGKPDDIKLAKPKRAQENSPDGRNRCFEENTLEGLDRVTRYWCSVQVNEESTRDDKKLIGLPLHLACHSGRTEVVRLMASSGANLDKQDRDGDRPLHYAVYGNEPTVVKLLLSLGAAVNATNKWKRTPLHVAASKAFVDCVRELVKYPGELDVTIQDDSGCTALHEAVGSNIDILALLLDCPRVDLRLKSSTGFNILHLAAVKGIIFATETIVSDAPELASVKDEDGYTPLHLAAMNGHREVASIILNQGECTVDDLSSRQRTALWLAVSEGHFDVVEMLVEHGADINKPDEDGNSPMHMSLFKRSEFQSHVINASTAPGIAAVVDHLLNFQEPGIDTNLALAWFLAKRGGDLQQWNAAGITSREIACSLGENVEESLLIWKTATSPEEDSCRGGAVGGEPDTISSDNGPTNCTGARPKTTEAKRLRSRLREMQSKFHEMEAAQMCDICCEKQRDVAFSCGHRACGYCAERLEECHLCRKSITSRITLY